MTEEIDEANLQFRYAGMQHPDGEFGAVVLDCTTYSEAIKTFRWIHGYITTSGAKELTVLFAQDSAASGEMLITINYADIHARIHIAGIEWSLVQRLCESLEIFPYYLILAGYSEGAGFHLLPAERYHLFKADVEVNGNRLYGNERPGENWDFLLRQI